MNYWKADILYLEQYVNLASVFLLCWHMERAYRKDVSILWLKTTFRWLTECITIDSLHVDFAHRWRDHAPMPVCVSVKTTYGSKLPMGPCSMGSPSMRKSCTWRSRGEWICGFPFLSLSHFFPLLGFVLHISKAKLFLILCFNLL